MKYLVTGHNRSGTNMLFRMVHAGGIPTLTEGKTMPLGSIGYNPNPWGFYESVVSDITDGHLVKINGIQNHQLHDDFIAAVIRREWSEVEMSHCKAFGATHGVTVDSYNKHYERLEEILSTHNIPYVVLTYSDVVRNMFTSLHKLIDIGFPINPYQAASQYTDYLYRNKAVYK
jgi:hypothetical protein